eukprot:SM000011S19015  [mRNA]  locus=s11:291675:299205:- [translate_table: standard]
MAQLTPAAVAAATTTRAGAGSNAGGAAAPGKVLVCCSSADHIDLQVSGKHQPTGFFLKELGRPLIRLLENNYQVVFANPKGNAPVMDPMSNSKLWFNPLHWSEKDEEVKMLDRMHAEGNLDRPRPFASISDAELESFDGILVPGGHAPMADLWNDPNLGRILLHFHNRAKPTGMICHAPIALLSTKQVQPNAPWAYAGYKMTCYSNREEKLNELLWMSNLPYKVETELRNNGAIMVEALPMIPKVTVDRELISAQGPTSADQFGAEFVKHLSEKSQPRCRGKLLHRRHARYIRNTQILSEVLKVPRRLYHLSKTADDGRAPLALQAARCATEVPSAAAVESTAAPAGAALGKVLICCSSPDHVDLQSGKQQLTGFFLKEPGGPLVRLLDSNYHVGNAPSMDPLSDSKLWFNPWHWSEKNEEVQLLERLHAEGNLAQPRTFASFSDEELESFDGVLIPGGRPCPMTDLWNDPELGRILLHFHKRSKPTGKLSCISQLQTNDCHAPIALLSTKQVQPTSSWAYDGYKMTCYSDAEEDIIELLWLGKLPYKAMGFI